MTKRTSTLRAALVLALVTGGCSADAPFEDPGDDGNADVTAAEAAEPEAERQFTTVFDGGIPGDGGVTLTADVLKAAVTQELADVRAGKSPITVQSQAVVRGGLPSFPGAHRDACSNARQSVSTPCAPDGQVVDGGFNLHYGFHCGSGWGGPTNLIYDDLDACCFYHDSTCWNTNQRTRVDEGGAGCSQTVNFINCVERVVPQNAETEAARRWILGSLIRVGADICELRPWWAWWPRGALYPTYDPRTASSGRCRSGPTKLTP